MGWVFEGWLELVGRRGSSAVAAGGRLCCLILVFGGDAGWFGGGEGSLGNGDLVGG